MDEQHDEKLYHNLQPGDLVAFSIVGRIESVSKYGYIVFAHGVEIPILKSSVRDVYESYKDVLKKLEEE